MWKEIIPIVLVIPLVGAMMWLLSHQEKEYQNLAQVCKDRGGIYQRGFCFKPDVVIDISDVN